MSYGTTAESLYGKSINVIGSLDESTGLNGHWSVSSRTGRSLYNIDDPPDTYQMIAQAFLGDANRWQEIYNIQTANWRINVKGGSTMLSPGDQLYMPKEAVDNANKPGIPGTAPAVVPTPAPPPRQYPVDPPYGPPVVNINNNPAAPAPPAPAPRPSAPAAPSGNWFMSLPTSEKVMIASGLLAGGGLAAWAIDSALKKHKATKRRAA